MRTLLLSLVLCLTLAGCVEQKLTITTDPPGASVRVSDVEKGTSPTTFDWTHPGNYEVILSRPGYQTKVEAVNIKPTWYEIPPFDFFAAISPFKHTDHRYVHIPMQKLVLPPNEQLIKQGLEMREETNKIGK